MSEMLSQAEIEALLADLANNTEAGGEQDQPSGASPFEPVASTGSSRSFARSIAYEVYDFRRPDKFAKDQLRTLQMLHETFARLASSSLAAYLRTPVQVELISLEQVPYEEYLLSINKSVFTIISLPPLTGQAVLELEFSLIFTIIDRMLGGSGKGFDRGTLSDIERPLLAQVLQRMFSALKTAWETVVMIGPGIEGMETSAQFVQVAPPSDIVITVLFEVRVGPIRGAMSLCIPYLVLKPITSKLSAQKWFSTGERKSSALTRTMLNWHVNRVTVPCAVRLGSTRLFVRQFLDLEAGDILKLDQETGTEMVLSVNKVDKFYGHPAVSGRKVIFNITGTVPD